MLDKVDSATFINPEIWLSSIVREPYSFIDRMKKYKNIDLILAPAMGGVIIGYEIGKLLKKETIFCERVNGKFALRRGFYIKKGSKVLIIEDVITTGKSSLECVKLITKPGAKLIGFASIIDRSTKNSLKIKKNIIIIIIHILTMV